MRALPRVGDTAAMQIAARLYERAEDDNGWDRAVEELADVMEGQVVCVHRYDLGVRAGEAVRVLRGLTPHDAEEYREHHASNNAWMERLAGIPQPGAVLVSHKVCPERELVEHRFYNEFLKPRGLFALLAIVVESGGHEFETVNMLRGRRPGRYTDEEESLARWLAPHVRSLHRLHRLLAAERARCRLLGEVLDRISTAVFALDKDLEIVECNRAALDLLATGDGLTAVRGRLEVRDPDARDELRGAIGALVATLRGRDNYAGGSFLVGRPSLARAYSATVLPIRSVLSSDAACGACCLLLVDDPEREDLPSVTRLIELWELTPAEARVACLLAVGRSPNEISDHLGVSINTVRTQLQKIFLKTDTTRQGELVRLFNRLGVTAMECTGMDPDNST